MGNESGDESARKPEITFMLSESGKSLLEKQALKANLSTSEYVELLVKEVDLLTKGSGAEAQDQPPVKQAAKWRALKRRDEFLIALAEVLIERRQELGISQNKVSEKAGLHRTYISDIENGSRNVTLESLARLSSALEISMSNLCRGAEEKLRRLE